MAKMLSQPVANSSLPYEKIVKDGNRVEYTFNDTTITPASIGLKAAVKAFAPGVLMGKTIPADQLYLSLGKLRATQHVLRSYNECVEMAQKNATSDAPTQFDGQSRLYRHHASELFSVLGFQVQNQTDKITVNGLDDLIASVEDVYNESIRAHRTQIDGGSVSFEGLGELFRPGIIVNMVTSLGSGGAVRAGCVVRSGFYEEKKTVFGKEKCFRMELEYIVAFGRYFATVRFEEIFAGWTGKTKSVKELPYYPADDKAIAGFAARGLNSVSMAGIKNQEECRYVEYAPGAFFPHGQKRAHISASGSGGRIVIDCERGVALGHCPSQGSDEATLAMMNSAARYKRGIRNASGATQSSAFSPNVEGILLLDEIPESLCCLIWPALVGFSFATKHWGHVLVDGLEEIKFNDRAFDLLVLTPQRKRLIKALVSFGGKATQSKFQDIVAGKSGGSVFLLHGPPGVGKTLTAEAIAELLHRPLYYVTMGELGTNPEEMEKRLGEVLELCAGWDALTIIDEADTFVEKRSGSDVVRNAMVCVMLRLIEYHQGILFLTTNRVLTFDPAFESRVTVALKYDDLTADAREKIWRNLIGNLKDVRIGSIDFKKLSETVMNGRQIKNAVRLALALAEDEGAPLSQELIEETLQVTALGRQEMRDAGEY